MENSRRTLDRLDANVLFGDGLEPLAEHAADGLSICGMGGKSMVRILSDFPERVPRRVVLQPNRDIDQVRRWGLQPGFDLADEAMVAGKFDVGQKCFVVLRFEQSTSSVDVTEAQTAEECRADEAYVGLDMESAVLSGLG